MEQAHNGADTSFPNSASAAEARESGEAISPEEQAKAERARRAEVAEQYSMYESYGMTYDQEKDRPFHNGQMALRPSRSKMDAPWKNHPHSL